MSARRHHRTLGLDDARRVAVAGQRLSGPRPRTVEEVVRDLCEVQMDPISHVARTEHLLLFSRIGRGFRVADLERALWADRTLFEYNAHIVPVDDLALYGHAMRRFREDGGGHAWYADWIAKNDRFRRMVLRELRARGPLRGRDLENRAEHAWDTDGRWYGTRPEVGTMLEAMWSRGEVMIVGRDGQQRIWDLAERRLPRIPRFTMAAHLDHLAREVRAAGIARPARLSRLGRIRFPDHERALETLVRRGSVVPVRIDGVPGQWVADAELLAAPPAAPRTTVLTPFDDLISDRARTERVFGFHYRIEIYVPKAERRFGYYVLPVLHGDRLIGRIDAKTEREEGVLRVTKVFAERGAPADAGGAVRGAIEELAAWLGVAPEVRTTPMAWRSALAD